jgi:pSer/pThr/pTyr-binding forkhead associated (FHA) protein
MPRLEVILPVPGLDDPRLTRIMPYTLTEPRYTIGRTIDNDIVLRGHGVSRVHATLERTDDGQYQIIDGSLDGKPSANGIYVKGRPRNKNTPHLLKDGVFIKILGGNADIYYYA